MSFLNPVSLPVKRFSSTDAGAPQINYNARTAGDVKAVLKACLVDGYGAIASAGWSIVNEVDHVAEFVSPSAAMSDFKLGVNDSTNANTTWYYQHYDATVKSGTANKVISGITKNSAENGWQLLVTDRGLFYVEVLFGTGINDKIARLFFFGSVKSALQEGASPAVGFWLTGINLSSTPESTFTPTSKNLYYKIGEQLATNISSIALATNKIDYGVSAIDLISEVMIEMGGAVIGQHSGILLLRPAQIIAGLGVKDIVVGGRPALQLCLTNNFGAYETIAKEMRNVVVYLDYWEY